MPPTTYSSKGLERRGRKLILAGAIALATLGYIVGLRAGVPEGSSAGVHGVSPDAPAAAGSGRALPALSYDQVGAGGLRAAQGSPSWLEMAAALRAPSKEPVTDMATRELSLALRGERRAFNGAPPTIPHDTRGLEPRACLACHGNALKIGDRVAKDLPHPYLANCTQCHAASAPAFLHPHGASRPASSWRGVATPRQGQRAAPGAPPMIPHTTHMRTNCLACHGPHGWPGVQTSHPERRSCLQCHAPTGNQDHPGLRLPGARFLPDPRGDVR